MKGNVKKSQIVTITDQHSGFAHPSDKLSIPADKNCRLIHTQLEYYEIRASESYFKKGGKWGLRTKLANSSKRFNIPAFDDMYVVVGRVKEGDLDNLNVVDAVSSLSAGADTGPAIGAVLVAAGVTLTALASGGLILGVAAVAIAGSAYSKKRSNRKNNVYVCRVGLRPYAHKGEKVYGAWKISATAEMGWTLAASATLLKLVNEAIGTSPSYQHL